MLNFNRVSSHIASIALAMFCGLCGFLLASYWQLKPAAYRVVYQYWPQAEGITKPPEPTVKEFSLDKMLPEQSAKLHQLIESSGILLPEIQAKFATIKKDSMSKLKQAGKGTYWIRILPPDGNHPVASIRWQGKQAPANVWPLVNFLEKPSHN